jgi:tRNA nucleotidyltransferase (CCA-adding enzyme)
MKKAVVADHFKELSGRRLFLELKLLLMEQEPFRAIERMNEFDLLHFISPKIRLTEGLRVLFREIRGALSWFDLLYLEEPYEPWKIYWYGLTSSLDKRALYELVERMQIVDLENHKLISQRLEVGSVLDKLYRLKKDNNYALYTLLSHYDTEILLYMLAKTNNEKIKRLISNYFTKLKGSKIMLKGKDLKGMGFQPGPLYKEIFNSILEARLNHLISTKKDEFGFVKERFGSHLEMT